MKLKKTIDTTDSNYEYNRVKKLYLMKFGNKEAKEWLGWDKGMAVPNCSCSLCKWFRSHRFTTKLTVNRKNRSWKEYRNTQWKQS
jgi:hypothetical protein